MKKLSLSCLILFVLVSISSSFQINATNELVIEDLNQEFIEDEGEASVAIPKNIKIFMHTQMIKHIGPLVCVDI